MGYSPGRFAPIPELISPERSYVGTVLVRGCRAADGLVADGPCGMTEEDA
jgi:hypothetical protein